MLRETKAVAMDAESQMKKLYGLVRPGDKVTAAYVCRLWNLQPFVSCFLLCIQLHGVGQQFYQPSTAAYCDSGNIGVNKYLTNRTICRKSLMINPTKFPVKVVTSWKLLGVVISLSIEPYGDRRRVHDVIDADYFGGEVLLLHFLNGRHPQTLAFLSAIMLIVGKSYTNLQLKFHSWQ